MIITRSVVLSAALFGMAALLAPGPAEALTRVVVENSTECPSDTVTTPCHTDLSEAITNAAAGDSIEIRPGTYTGNFTLNKSVSLYGNETARTFLSGGGSGTILIVENITTAMSIRRLTFINAPAGILVRNSSNLKITNNVFQVSGTAVETVSASTTEVTNNTFYNNANSIVSDTATLNIVNNLFTLDQSGTAISPVTMDITAIQNNLFYRCTIGPAVVTDSSNPDWKGNIANQDPLLVDPDNAAISDKDFHLEAGSPAINVGSTSPGLNTIGDTTKTDIGAYGATSDTIQFRVGSVTPSTPSGSIYLRWPPNNSYLASGYKVYYGSSSGDRAGTGATQGDSPLHVTATSATVSGLTATASAPAAPTLYPLQIRNESLGLSWSAVPFAKKYNVYYGTTSPPTTLAATVNTTAHTLTGLSNGQTYYVSIKAVNQAIYYFTVTAVDSMGTTSAPGVTPGVTHESIYSEPETVVEFGTAVEGAPSNIQGAYPERLYAYPILPEGNQGCFIATAAYGQYSAPEVRVLRAFRDRYLLTTSLGRAFVGWYYHYSPAAAAALNAHPTLKPVVRAALLPVVGGAYLLIRTPLLFAVSLSILLGCAVFLLLKRKQLSRFGGNQ